MGRLASWPVLVVSGLVFAAFAGVLFASSASFGVPNVEQACGAPPPDVRFYSTAEEVNDFLAGCGKGGRAAYRNLQIADLFYPAVFGLFMASALALTLDRLFGRRSRLVALASIAFVGSALDYVENVFAWIALTTYPDATTGNSLLGLASAGKTIAFWAAGVGLMAGIAALVAMAVRRRGTNLGREPGRASARL